MTRRTDNQGRADRDSGRWTLWWMLVLLEGVIFGLSVVSAVLARAVGIPADRIVARLAELPHAILPVGLLLAAGAVGGMAWTTATGDTLNLRPVLLMAGLILVYLCCVPPLVELLFRGLGWIG